jgi:protein O-mannosyl-transferase
VSHGRAYALVLAVALAASASSLANGFVYDDGPAIARDPRVHTLAALPSLLLAPYWGPSFETNQYRPATTVAFALEWAAGGGSPLAFHATNVVLNLAVVALVLALALRVLPPEGAVVAALWFGVQPVHVEAVANSVGVGELITAVGYLGALLAYLADGAAAAAGRGSSWRRAALALAVLGGAVLAYGGKESGITLPATLLLADLWQAGGDRRGAWARLRRHGVLWLGVVALALEYLLARWVALGPLFGGGAVAPGLEGASTLGRVLIMAPAVLIWLRWFLWPVRFSADYLPNAFMPDPHLGLAQLAGFAALALLALAAWRARRRLPAVTAGLLFVAVTASVAANVVVPTGVIVAERLAYLPSFGVALAVGALWTWLPRGRALWPATAIALALLGARTVARSAVWHDSATFLAALRRDAPDSFRTHWALGQEAFGHGRRTEGERQMLSAIRIHPDTPALLDELGERYLENGLFEPAARYLLAAYAVDSLRSGSAARAVFALLKGGRADSALDVGIAALRRFPRAAPLLKVTATAELAAGRPRQALGLARRLVFATGGGWDSEQLAGLAAAAAGRCDEARFRFERAAARAPVPESAPRRMLALLGRGPGCGLPAPGAEPRPKAGR